MRRAYNRQEYLIFLDNEFIKKFLNQHLDKYFPGFIECLEVDSKYYRVLAATSFLVRYNVTLKTRHGFVWHGRMRGNRLNPISCRVLEHLWQTHKYKKYYYPRPIHYFSKKHFLLYESYDGMIYRDYHKKNKKLYYKTIPLIAQRLADFHQTKKGLAKNRTIKEELGFLKTVLKKIKDHNQPFYPTALKAANIIKGYIKKNYQPENFTLIHNDFQPSNVVYNTYGHNLGIIDYEPLCQFFPSVDLASFITHFKVRLKNYLSQKTLNDLQQKFFRTYFKYTKSANLAKIKQDLPYFTVRSLLDIMAVAAVYLSLSRHRRHRRQFKQLIKYLKKEVENLLLIID